MNVENETNMIEHVASRPSFLKQLEQFMNLGFFIIHVIQEWGGVDGQLPSAECQFMDYVVGSGPVGARSVFVAATSDATASM